MRILLLLLCGCSSPAVEPSPAEGDWPKCVDGYLACETNEIGPNSCEIFYAHPYACLGYTGHEPCKIVAQGPRVSVERCVELYDERAMLEGVYGWYRVETP